jgi:glycogen debranching enzyme
MPDDTAVRAPIADHIQLDSEFYIVATAAPADDQRRVLKHDDAFLLMDRYGDMQHAGLGEQGLYFEGTRFLSHWLLGLGRERPLLLDSSIGPNNGALTVQMTNPDMRIGGEVAIRRGTLQLQRTTLLWRATAYQRVTIVNYGLAPIRFTLIVQFGADFADIFEVRGVQRRRHGRRLRPIVERDRVVLGYEGLDGVARRSAIRCEPAPQALTRGAARFELALQPKAGTAVTFSVACETSTRPRSTAPLEAIQAEAAQTRAQAAAEAVRVHTSHEQLNEARLQARADLDMMRTRTPWGDYPYAGVPWFSTPFGRDGLLTALEMLWLDPGIARGVLGFLAAHQATETIPDRDAEPGKILHELRHGELAAIGEIPFGRYYGSADATPLFVMLAGAYYERTGDEAFLRTLWPHLQRALAWIDGPGDADQDGFVEYQRKSPHGLLHQGWKDSHDAVFHADGELAEPPIALCEVQGYVYAAKCAAAEIAAGGLGEPDRAEQLLQQAAQLQERFEQVFWCDELGTYALALDGRKRPCRVRTSNPPRGHCLLAGIASPERAARLAEQLLQPSMDGGWGIRTVAETERRYNPMSYHNGSVWPHDNALIALGLARYGFNDLAARLLSDLVQASLNFERRRLPELFCGFARTPESGPTNYPVACSPQAWACGALFLMIQACLGLTLNARAGEVRIMHPVLPEAIEDLWIERLAVGSSMVNLHIHRVPSDVNIVITKREGEVEVVVVR